MVRIPLVALALFAVLVALSKLGYDLYRRDNSLALARLNVERATPEGLVEAKGIVEAELRRDSQDEVALDWLAMIISRQLLDGRCDPAEAERVLVRYGVEARGAEYHLLGGMLAFVGGDTDAAGRAAARVLDRADTSRISSADAWRYGAWLQGLVALHAEVTPEVRAAARVNLQHADGDGVRWPGFVAVAAALAARAGDPDLAREWLAPDDRSSGALQLELEVASAWIGATAYLEADEGAPSLDALIEESSDLPPHVVARAHATRAAARLRRDDPARAKATADLVKAWQGAPAWDRDLRLSLVELAIEARAFDRAREWRALPALGGAHRDLFGAWLTFVEEDARASLGELAELPQSHPHVALLQTLALAEEGRWVEAAPWFERASAVHARRPAISVLRGRILLRVSDPETRSQARADLEALSETMPYAWRVWTGLGEAYRLAGADDETSHDQARAAFRLATEREVRPAEAWMQLAELVRDKADTPASAETARDYLKRAREAAPQALRYTVAHAGHLAGMGYPGEAVRSLEAVVERPEAEASLLVDLARMTVKLAAMHRNRVPEKVTQWLDRAAGLGAGSDPIEIERARFELASRRRSVRDAGHGRLVAVLQRLPSHVEARLLYAESARRRGDPEVAAATLRQVMAEVPKQTHGALHVALARAESAQGERQSAARSAARGWRQLLASEVPAARLLEAAPVVINAWLEIKQPGEARKVARQLAARVPYHAAAWAVHAQLQIEAGMLKAGCRSAARAISLDSAYAPAQAAGGACFSRRGRRSQAQAAYRKAVGLARGDAERRRYRKALVQIR